MQIGYILLGIVAAILVLALLYWLFNGKNGYMTKRYRKHKKPHCHITKAKMKVHCHGSDGWAGMDDAAIMHAVNGEVDEFYTRMEGMNGHAHSHGHMHGHMHENGDDELRAKFATKSDEEIIAEIDAKVNAMY